MLPILGLLGVDYKVERIIAAILFCLLSVGIVRLHTSSFWGPRIKQIYRRKFVVVALIFAGVIFSIAFLDAFAWKDKVEDNAKVSLEAQAPRSIFDRIFSQAVGVKEFEYRESSYSAPLAKTEFVDKEVELKFRHLLGTTRTGYDTFYMTLKGAKPGVIIGILPLLIAIPLALLLGVSAGYFGGRVDDFVVYFYTTISSIPGLLLLIALITVFGQGLPQIALGLGITGWIGLCRLVRGESLKLREMEYVQAARCLGVSDAKIIRNHIIPNLMHLVIITGILAFTGLVLTESILSYLGIGLDFSWGAMIDQARAELSREPAIYWNLLSASIGLFLLVFSVNVVGDAVRDVLDPRAVVAVAEEGKDNE